MDYSKSYYRKKDLSENAKKKLSDSQIDEIRELKGIASQKEIADKYGIRVIYDAAHCFGVEIAGSPIGIFGDLSMFSFHATKIFHTFEGGALTFKDNSIKERLELSKNFGFRNEENIVVPGINGKLNEFQAAIGLLMLKLIDAEIEKRKRLSMVYCERLIEIPGIKFRAEMFGVKHNYYNFVITVNENKFGISRDDLYDNLKTYNIFTRKYFYPLCSQFQCYRQYPSSSLENLPVAEIIAKEVLSLPLYSGLEVVDIHKICDLFDLIHTREQRKINTKHYEIRPLQKVFS